MPKEKTVMKEGGMGGEGLTVRHWASILAVALGGIALITSLAVAQGLSFVGLLAFGTGAILAYYLLKDIRMRSESEIRMEKHSDLQMWAIGFVFFATFLAVLVLNMGPLSQGQGVGNALLTALVILGGIAAIVYIFMRQASAIDDNEYRRLKADVAEIKRLIKGAEDAG